MIGEAGVPHAWKYAEAAPQIFIESSEPLVFVVGLPRIQTEHQHVLTIESQLDRMKVGNRAHKETGRHHQQQRDRNLRYDQ